MDFDLGAVPVANKEVESVEPVVDEVDRAFVNGFTRPGLRF